MTTSPFWTRNFVLYFLGSLQNALGSSIGAIALSYVVLNLTHSSAALGLNLALYLAPAIIAPLFGPLIDRWPLKMPLVISNLILGGGPLLIVTLLTHHKLLPGLLYLTTLLMGAVSAAATPAAQSVLPYIVAQDHLARANGVLAGTAQTARLVGLLAGGVLVGRMGAGGALLWDGVTTLLMAAVFMLMQFPAKLQAEGQSSYRLEFMAGVQTLAATGPLRITPLLAFFLNGALAPVEVLMPRHLLATGHGPQAYGLLLTMFAVGMLLGSLSVSAIGSRVRPYTGLTGGLTVVSVAMLGMAFVGTYWGLLAWTLVLGIGAAANGTYLFTALQQEIPAAYLGRVFSLFGAASQLGMPLMLLLLVPVADRVQLSTVLAGGGVLGLALLMAWRWAVKTSSASPAPVAG